ncbi:MAG TPA: D-cysteine desulfhydrase family protein [Chloroflexota bacterium]|nr:D-cysteine desulfhydrase family protein [Chloroflexota bacterium]
MIDASAAEALVCALLPHPRVPLAQLPTPLEDAPRLSERLGLRVLIKRDDQTGLALGGNKARKLEFLLGQALAEGADLVITTGGTQSNHARMTAAACRKLGLACRLILNRGPHNELQGNLLLDHMFGADVTVIDSENPADAVPALEAAAAQARADGGKPYLIPRGGSVPTGATGYAAMIPELMAQLDAMQIHPSILYLATGSTGTHSGTLAGLAALGFPFPIQGISVSRPSRMQQEQVLDLTRRTLAHLGLNADVPESASRVDDRFVGPGYGYPTDETMAAIETLALDEGIVLDPVYTGKAMAGLLAHAREGRVGSDDVVVFLHTGGAPALFAYNAEVAATAPA